MRFKEFLVLEKKDSIEHVAELICHKIHDMIDHSHVDVEEGKISFDLGRVIKNSSYTGTTVVITNDASVDGDIVIQTNQDLDRSNLQSLVANKTVYSKLLQKIKEYLIYDHDYKDVDENSLTTHEKHNLHADKAHFDQKYDTLISAFKQKIQSLTDEVSELQKELKNTGLHSKRESIQAAIKLLVDEKVGKDFKQFQKIIMNLEEADFVKYITGDMKKMLQSRLHDFYEGYLTNFVKNFNEVD